MRALALGVALGVSSIALPASAQVDARLLSRALAGRTSVPSAFRAGAEDIAGLIELPAGAATPPGLVSVAPGFAAFRGDLATFGAMAEAHPDWRVTWSPPRRPLLDLAKDVTHIAQFRNVTGLTGHGVVVGIVDTGFDPKHPDLRDENGKSRVGWVLDLSRQPVGRHPDLEAAYGCMSSGTPCSVLSGEDLDELIGESSPILPRDTLGHGTHVTSLAAGNGLSQSPPRYVGMAPDATIVVARVTRSGDGSILDPDVLLATRFVYDRAKELGMPAVVNLSLGSDFGGHDGQAPLERGLSAFVGPDYPGRAMVVAAGNSAGVYSSVDDSYPGPFGIHTEVHVPRTSSVRVPLLTPPVGKSSTRATIYVWIAGRPGDELEVGFGDADDEWIAPLPPGHGTTETHSGVEVTIINQEYGVGSPIAPGSNGAVVVVDGTFSAGKTFVLRLEGHGTARLWLQSEGDLSPGAAGPGALFPRSTKEGTIGIPASSADLISVGATLNRITWTDRDQQKIKLGKLGSLEDPKSDSSAYFSGSGPNQLGQMKPDIVAPGAFVIGAMSSLADPKKNGGAGIFSVGSVCGEFPFCLVVDDYHAISSGTSMAAPIVSGGIALLFERDPSLTQNGVRTLLQAGARALDGTVLLEQQIGPGEINLMGTLAVLDADESPLQQVPAREESWVALAESYAHPDPDWPLDGVLELRAADESIVDGFDPKRLSLEVDGATAETPLTRVAPGLWRFSVVAPAGSGGSTLTLRVRFDASVLLERSVPVAVDRWVAEGGVAARGGCSLDARPVPSSGLWLLVMALSIVGLSRRNESPSP